MEISEEEHSRGRDSRSEGHEVEASLMCPQQGTESVWPDQNEKERGEWEGGYGGWQHHST